MKTNCLIIKQSYKIVFISQLRLNFARATSNRKISVVYYNKDLFFTQFTYLLWVWCDFIPGALPKILLVFQQIKKIWIVRYILAKNSSQKWPSSLLLTNHMAKLNSTVQISVFFQWERKQSARKHGEYVWQ